jgi:hypothetical protein
MDEPEPVQVSQALREGLNQKGKSVRGDALCGFKQVLAMQLLQDQHELPARCPYSIKDGWAHAGRYCEESAKLVDYARKRIRFQYNPTPS